MNPDRRSGRIGRAMGALYLFANWRSPRTGAALGRCIPFWRPPPERRGRFVTAWGQLVVTLGRDALRTDGTWGTWGYPECSSFPRLEAALLASRPHPKTVLGGTDEVLHNPARLPTPNVGFIAPVLQLHRYFSGRRLCSEAAGDTRVAAAAACNAPAMADDTALMPARRGSLNNAFVPHRGLRRHCAAGHHHLARSLARKGRRH